MKRLPRFLRARVIDYLTSTQSPRCRPWDLSIANVTAALRWRISPRWLAFRDFPAQMNLVSTLSDA